MIFCLQSKGTRISSRKQDDFVGFRSIRSSTSGLWLEKSGKHVGPNFTLKPSTKARSLQFCKTEIKTDNGGEKKRNKRRIYGLLVNGRDLRHYTKQVKPRAGERFIHKAHLFMSVSFYTYLCIYVCLHLQFPLDHINSVALEWIVTEVRWQSLVKIWWFLCHCEIIKNNFIKIRSCSVWILWLAVFAWSPLGHYLRELLVKK